MRKRLIPVLLVDSRHRLVKTIKFSERTYVGDPFNVVRLFNEKEVDEICILDVDASKQGRTPDFGFVRELSSECFMPLAYGGGIKQLTDCEQLNRAGVEKFILGQAAYDTELVRSIVRDIGSQAVTACIDVVGHGNSVRCVAPLTRKDVVRKPLELCRELQDQGVGEIILQSVDLDGARTGYDLELINEVSRGLSIPVIALGGAGEAKHLAQGLHAGASAAASGSTFVFIGKLRAVLVNYPDPEQMDVLAKEYE
jgi:imidazole glycerol-phosphate synthase subunit HisF